MLAFWEKYYIPVCKVHDSSWKCNHGIMNCFIYDGYLLNSPLKFGDVMVSLKDSIKLMWKNHFELHWYIKDKES